jgi:hypothetical protein
LGAPGADFFGTNSVFTFSTNANLLIIPVNLKVGYAPGPWFRISAHGGGNLLYQSVGNSLSRGPYEPNAGPASAWSFFGNTGMDIELGASRRISILLRPDITFATGNTIFAGTLGLGIGLG